MKISKFKKIFNHNPIVEGGGYWFGPVEIGVKGFFYYFTMFTKLTLRCLNNFPVPELPGLLDLKKKTILKLSLCVRKNWF